MLMRRQSIGTCSHARARENTRAGAANPGPLGNPVRAAPSPRWGVFQLALVPPLLRWNVTAGALRREPCRGAERQRRVVTPPSGVTSAKNPYRPTLVRRGATLGANCTIVCGVTIGAFAFIGAGAVVNRDVPDFALMLGVPARQVGWMSRFGERLALPLTGQAEVICPHTGDRYLLDGSCLRLRTVGMGDQSPR